MSVPFTDQAGLILRSSHECLVLGLRLISQPTPREETLPRRTEQKDARTSRINPRSFNVFGRGIGCLFACWILPAGNQ